MKLIYVAIITLSLFLGWQYHKISSYRSDIKKKFTTKKILKSEEKNIINQSQISPSAVELNSQNKINATQDSPNVNETNRENDEFDSLSDLEKAEIANAQPVDAVAVPVEKLTPEELEQHKIGNFERNMVEKNKIKNEDSNETK